jgi:hypothetical protein
MERLAAAAYHEGVDAERDLQEKVTALLPYLNERQRRLFLAVEASALGHGGVARVARAAGVSRPTIQQGLRELTGSAAPTERVRRVGGGRKSLTERDPGLLTDLEALVDPDTRGDPMSPLRWTCKSTRQLAGALQERGHRVGYRTVAALLDHAGYSLQAAAKTLDGTHHPDRDAFHCSTTRSRFWRRANGLGRCQEELVGTFKNGGRSGAAGAAGRSASRFPGQAGGKAIPRRGLRCRP